MRIAPLALTAALGLAAALPLSAQQVPAAAAVKARQAHMTLYAANLGVLGGMAQGRMEYDAAMAQAAADNLAVLSQMDQGLYWMPGTSVDDVEGSRALPAIWEDGSDIQAHGMALAEAAVASDGLEAVQGAMGPIGAACGGCHEDYRQSND